MSTRSKRDFVIEAIACATRDELEDGLARRTDLASDVGKRQLSRGVWRLTLRLKEGIAPKAFGTAAGRRRRATLDDSVPDQFA